MAIDFSKINLEVIDISTNADPDIYINQNGITFSKRVLEDLNYPQNVQYGFDPEHHIFAIRVCKSNESKAAAFSKPRAEQTTTLSCGNKNLKEIVAKLIPDYKEKKRYKVTGELDAESRVLYFDMTTAEESAFRTSEK
jgi:hypothetical protein